MSVAALIDEYIDLKIEGEPKWSDWRSISENGQARDRYSQRLEQLRAEIDAALAAPAPQDTKGAES